MKNLKLKKIFKNPYVIYSIFLALLMSYAWWRSSNYFHSNFNRYDTIPMPQR